MSTKLKKRKRPSRKSSKRLRTQQGGKVNTNTLLLGLAIIILIVVGKDIFAALAAKYGLMRISTEVKEITVYRDRYIYAPTVEPSKSDLEDVADAVAASGMDPVSILAKHIIPVPKPAPGRDVKQSAYIVKPKDKKILNEDGSHNLDLIIHYDAKLIFGFRFNPMLTVGYNGFDIAPGVGATFFQFYRLQTSAHVSHEYAAIGASWLVYKSTGLGVGYGFTYGKMTPGFVLFGKVDF